MSLAMHKLLELRQKRAQLVKEARTVLDKADAEKRSLSPEERTKYDAMQTEIDTFGDRIKDEERQLLLEQEMGKALDHRTSEGPDSQEQRDGKTAPNATPEYRSAFENQLLRGSEPIGAELRSLAKSGASNAGYLVPEAYELRIREIFRDSLILLDLVEVITSSMDRNLIMEGDIGESGWIDELGEYPESDMDFGAQTLSAYKAGRIMKVSEELLADEAVNLLEYIARKFARTNSELKEAAFINGDGIKKPRGILLDAELGHTAPSASAITADDIIDLVYSLDEAYVNRATMLMHRSTLKAVRKLKDSQGNYLYSPGLNVGDPDFIERRPVRTSAYMPEIGTGAKPILFGDFKAYTVVERSGIYMQRLNELFAASGQIGFRGYERLDGKVLDPKGFKVLQMA